MKKIFITILTLGFISQVTAQDIAGSWIGVPTGLSLHLIFNIKKASDTSYTATFDSPDQKAFDIACGNTYVKGDSIFIKIPIINGGFSGAWDKKDNITGLFKQGIAKIKLDIKRVINSGKTAHPKALIRPQTPKPPFGYYTEDVEYDNADKSQHYGATFTRPDGSGRYPAAIII